MNQQFKHRSVTISRLSLLFTGAVLLTSCGGTSFLSGKRSVSIKSSDSTSASETSANESQNKTGTATFRTGESLKDAKENPDSQSDEPKDDVTAIAECGKKLGLPTQSIRIAGNQTTVSLQKISSVKEGFVIRVTGNQAKLNLRFNLGENVASIGGICLFMAGNQPQISIDLDAPVDFIYVKGRGNQSSANINVLENGSLLKGEINLAGNSAKVMISGKGNTECPNVQYVGKGNGSDYSCTKM